MQGKKQKIIILIVAVVLIASVVFGLFFVNRVNLRDDAKAEIYYTNQDIEVHSNLSDKESKIIAEMFDSNRLHSDKESLSKFDDKIYISFQDGKTIKNFYIAFDGSPIVKYKGKVFEIEFGDMDHLHAIVGAYGAHFPCDKI